MNNGGFASTVSRCGLAAGCAAVSPCGVALTVWGCGSVLTLCGCGVALTVWGCGSVLTLCGCGVASTLCGCGFASTLCGRGFASTVSRCGFAAGCEARLRLAVTVKLYDGLCPSFGLSPYRGLSPLLFLSATARHSLASH